MVCNPGPHGKRARAVRDLAARGGHGRLDGVLQPALRHREKGEGRVGYRRIPAAARVHRCGYQRCGDPVRAAALRGRVHPAAALWRCVLHPRGERPGLVVRVHGSGGPRDPHEHGRDGGRPRGGLSRPAQGPRGVHQEHQPQEEPGIYRTRYVWTTHYDSHRVGDCEEMQVFGGMGSSLNETPGVSVQSATNDGADAGRGPVALPGSDEFKTICLSLDKRPFAYRFVKRGIDLVVSSFVILFGFIPAVILSILIALDTKGTPIYSQARVGRGGKPFKIYKFRSMVSDSDNVEKYFTPEQLEVWRSERKVDDDPRVTPLGRIIRKLSIDEFPQFINVFLGQISIVGPRVITYDELSHYGDDAALLLSVPQGISGAWQCGPRNLATFENGMRQRIELDYARRSSLRRDAHIFFKTFSVMFVERTGK